MLVERGLRVMNVEVVGDAYAIASNYLRQTGAIPDSFATNERLLEIIVRDVSPRRIQQDPARQQGDREVRSQPSWSDLDTKRNSMEAAIDRIMMTYDLLVNRTAAASAEARAKVTDYRQHAGRSRRKGYAPADGVRADLSARARRLQRSGEGGIYRAVSSPRPAATRYDALRSASSFRKKPTADWRRPGCKRDPTRSG